MDYGLYNANETISSKLKASGINRVTFGDPSEFDQNKNGVMPYSHMVLDGSLMRDATHVYNYRIWVADLVDSNNISPREVFNSLTLSDNKEDIFHDLAQRINKFKSLIRQDLDIIESTNEIDLSTIGETGQHALIGYEFAFSITVESPGIC